MSMKTKKISLIFFSVVALIFITIFSIRFGSVNFSFIEIVKALFVKNYAVGTVEGYPEFDNVVKKLKDRGVKDVILMPFMFVAGDHAQNDIAGDWNENLQKAGFTVSKVILMGLGQNEDIQNIYVDHIKFITHHKPEDIASKKVQYSKEKD